MGTRRTRFAESDESGSWSESTGAGVISDHVPTCSDEVTNVTRLELARVLCALDMTNDTSAQPTAMDDDVFADAFSEDTLELYIDYDRTM